MIVEKVDNGVTLWSKRLALVLLGWFASSAYHGTLTAEKAVKAVPVLQAEAGCEHWRANKTIAVAKQAILSANSVDAAPPSAAAIPKDNCDTPSVPPAVHPATK